MNFVLLFDHDRIICKGYGTGRQEVTDCETFSALADYIKSNKNEPLIAFSLVNGCHAYVNPQEIIAVFPWETEEHHD